MRALLVIVVGLLAFAVGPELARAGGAPVATPIPTSTAGAVAGTPLATSRAQSATPSAGSPAPVASPPATLVPTATAVAPTVTTSPLVATPTASIAVPSPPTPDISNTATETTEGTPPAAGATAPPLVGVVTLTASPTLAVQTATPTATTDAIGGRNFSLMGGPPRMTWSPGTTQTGYLLVRWSPAEGTAFLPPPTSPLPPSTTSFTDPSALGNGLYCYVVVPMSGPDVLAISDFLCLIPNTASGVGTVTNFTIRLEEATARLSWQPASGHTSYQITAFTFDGTGPRALPPLGPAATSHEDDMGGRVTCYLLSVMSGIAAIGSGHVVCAIPGVSTGFAPPASGPDAAPDTSSPDLVLPDLDLESLVNLDVSILPPPSPTTNGQTVDETEHGDDD